MGKLEVKTSDPKKPYRCLYCGKGFLYKVTLKRHCEKNVCGMIPPQLMDEEATETHREKEMAKTPNERSYKCCKCQKDFSSEKWYLKHMSNKCLALPSKRGFLKKTLTQLECSTIVNYSDTHHTNEVDQNPKSGVNRKTMFLEKSSSKTNRVLCIVCRQEYPSIQELEIHMREHLSTEISAHQLHKEKHNQDFKAVKHRCKYCSKIFSKKKNLSIHIAKHKKDFPCSICDKTFSRKFMLISHMKTHTRQNNTSDACEKANQQTSHPLSFISLDKERPYTCTVCKQGFQKLCGLASHARTHGGWEKLNLVKDNQEINEDVHQEMLNFDKDNQDIDESVRNDTAVYITEEPDRERNGIEGDNHIQIMEDPLDHVLQFIDDNIVFESTDIAGLEMSEDVEGGLTAQNDVEAWPMHSTEDDDDDDYLLPHSESGISYLDISLNDRPETESVSCSYSNQDAHREALAPSSSGYCFSRNVDEVCASSSHSEPCDLSPNDEMVQNKTHEITVYIMESGAAVATNEIENDDDGGGSPNGNAVADDGVVADDDGDDTEATVEASCDPLQKDNDVNESSSSEYCCLNCGETFYSCIALDDHTMTCYNGAKKSALRKQNTTDHGNLQKYKCSVCWTDFLFHSDLIEHMETHSLKYKCNVCKKKFKSKHGLALHLKLHSGLEQYACEVCSLTFESESSFNLHCETHDATDDGEEDCEAETDDDNDDMDHYSADTHEDTIYCDKEFSNDDGDVKEMTDATAVAQEMFSCSVCDKQFRKKNGLILHLKMHFSYRPFVCNTCDLTFRSAKSLTLHQYKHKNDGASTHDSRKINIESKGSSQELSIWEQESYMLDETSITELADKSLIPDDLLDSAQISSSARNKNPQKQTERLRMQDDRPAITDTEIQSTKNGEEGDSTKLFICPVCGKKCVKKSSFVLHLKCHPGMEPFSCNICSMSFSSKKALSQHRELCTHHKEDQNKGSNNNQTLGLLPHEVTSGSDEDTPRDVCAQDDIELANDASGMHTRISEEDAALMKRFICPVCRKQCVKKSSFVLHLKLHPGLRPFACNLCSHSFLTKLKLSIHMEKHKHERFNHLKNQHLPEASITDTIGNQLFTTQDVQVTQFQSNDKDPPNRLIDATVEAKLSANNEAYLRKNNICPVCKKKCTKKNSFVQHLKTHPGINAFECNVCFMTFSSKVIMLQHKESHIIGRRPASRISTSDEISNDSGIEGIKFPEQLMASTTSSVGNSEINDEITDEEIEPDSHFQSNSAEPSKTVTDATVHAQLGKAEAYLRKRNICPVCRRKCAKKNSFIMHLKTHPGVNPFECNVCPMTFSSKVIMLQHKESHIIGRQPMSRVGMLDEKNNDLVNESIQFSMQLNVPSSSSAEDGQIADVERESDSHFQSHSAKSSNTHSDVTVNAKLDRQEAHLRKNNICPVCKKKCVKKSSFVLHLRTHPGLNPYECTACLMSFPSKFVMLLHKEKHGKGREPTSTIGMPNIIGQLTVASSSLAEDGTVTDEERALNSQFQPYSEESSNALIDATVNAEEATHLRKKNICPVCKKKCVKKNSFVMHLKTHPGLKPYECNVCFMTFSSRLIMLQHKESHLKGGKSISTIGVANESNNLAVNARTSFSQQLTVSTSSSTEDGTSTDEERTPNSKLQSSCAESPNILTDADVNAEEEAYLRKNNICPVCHKTCMKKNSFVMHLKTHPGLKPYECNVCLMPFSSKLMMLEHKESHLKGKQPRIGMSNAIKNPSENERTPSKPMKTMSTIFAEDSEIANKERRTNLEKPPLMCNTCDVSFITVRAFLDHHVEHTSEGKINSCPICGLKFSCTRSVAIHVGMMHTSKGPISSEVSETTSNSHQQEQKIGEQLHVCTICNLNFSSIMLLFKHCKELEHQSTKCPICSRVFKSKYHRSRHIETHINVWDCPFCDKKGLRGGNFFRHMKGIHRICSSKIDSYKTFNSDRTNEGDEGRSESRNDKEQVNGCVRNNDPALTVTATTDTANEVFSGMDFENTRVDLQDSRSHYKCDVCSKVMTYKKRFIKHLEIHKNEEVMLQITDRPLENFPAESDQPGNVTDEENFAEQIHTDSNKTADHSFLPDKPEFNDNMEEQSVHWKDYLQEQMRTQGRFKCNICGKILIYKKSFMTHLDTHGSRGIMLKNVNKEITIKSHRAKRVPRKRSLACSKCDKKFIYLKSLLSHKKMHSRTGSFKCGKCGKNFKRKQLLESHLSEHGNDTSGGSCQTFLSGHELLNPLNYRKIPSDNTSNLDEDVSYTDANAEMHVDHSSIMPDISKNLAPSTSEPMEIPSLTQEVPHEISKLSDGNAPADIDTVDALLNAVPTHQTDLGGSRTERYHTDKCNKFDEVQDSQNSLSTGKESYVCPICDKSFSRYQKLVSHEKIHLEPLLYDCDKCAQSFQSKADYDTHLKIHQKSPSAVYECPFCDKQVFHVANFTRHFVSHGVSADSVNMQDFIVNSNSRKSMKSGETYTSTAIDITETKNTTVDANQGKMHSTSAMLGNVPCNAQTPSVGNNYQNMANTNSSSSKGNLKCFVCHKMFANSAELSLHKHHHAQPTRTCTFCGKVFRKKNKCVDHMMRHSERDLRCKICPKRFIRRVDFASHMEDHGVTEEKDVVSDVFVGNRAATAKVEEAENLPASSSEPEKGSVSEGDCLQETISVTQNYLDTSVYDSSISKNACHICNRVYSSKYYLQTHMQVHSKYMLFKCRYCPKFTQSLSKLKRHIKTHGIKRFSCKKCGSSFSSKYEIITHIKRRHKSILPYSDQIANDLIVKANEYETQIVGKQAGASNVRIESEAFGASSRSSKNEDQSYVKCNAFETKEKIKNSGDEKDKVVYADIASKKCSESEEKIFECPVCQKQLSSQSFLNIHRITHYVGKVLQCPLCDISLESYFDWKKHIIDMHAANPDSMEPCISEENESVSMQSGDEAVRKRNKDENKCGICHKILPDIRSMRAHLYNHEVGTDDLRCRQCGREYKYKFTLTRHMERAHGVDHRLLKNFGKRRFMENTEKLNRNEMQKNRASYFVGAKRDSVISCNDESTSKLGKNDMRVHSPEYVHDGRNIILQPHNKHTLTCKMCGKMCRDKYNFDDHMITHSSHRPHKCFLCPTTFKRKQNLKRHMRNVHSSDLDSDDLHQSFSGVDSTHKRPVCYKEFPSDSVLKSHMSLHTGVRNIADPGDEEVYECTVERNDDDDDILEVEHNVEEMNISVQEEGVIVEDIAIDIKEEIIDEDMDEDMEDIPFEDFQVYGSSYLEKEGSYSGSIPFSLGNIPAESPGREISKNMQDKFSKSSSVSYYDVESVENQTLEDIPSGNFAMVLAQKEYQNQTTRSLNASSRSEPEEHPSEITLAENFTLNDTERSYAKTLFKRSKKIQLYDKKLCNDRKNVHCKICNVTFASSSQLLCHIRVHPGLVYYKCDVCGENANSGASYKNHSTLHVTEYVDCRSVVFADIPVEEIPLPTSVPDFYRRTETLEKVLRNDPRLCVICGKLFKNEQQVKAHRHLHFRLLLRACDSCGTCFSGTGVALSHRFQHLTIVFGNISEEPLVMNTEGNNANESQNEQLPYSCSLCSETFEFSESFEAHKLKHNIAECTIQDSQAEPVSFLTEETVKSHEI